ncbi:competence/damage-inducible protein A [Synechococcus sp. CS-602]|uniref:competence/damage-inducible protein A n=1 Tax=Synechococcaceae TaxID=1890426 RepID=UPI0009F89E63|nr:MULTISPECIES: competence/damage-inducible protein A [Synechococcaceae]MCT4364932.1 competence/damage-inducible protein A [Candidatus Regnicoccus frigidus MAG-AL1]MCT0203434.1 competence/damage-inducible protein A [Synechococcus sp. CS-603]MCT0204082.1 competence/damage-inducible protein A [Synechococcus sp. CS-602]MCT0246654.1 competence/damage-inducible protein A [Synechococcus sp. CS-601]MCT4368370.1 competence/damage-inducible protein A [Candidatus Regnicoccus frigidus MAG-AL2]
MADPSCSAESPETSSAAISSAAKGALAAEILCIGTELLLGTILNGNARWLAEELAAQGLPHYRQTVVGDNRERLIQVVRECAQRCSLLVCTGGLGPTPDDLTTEALAAAFGAPLQERPEIWADISAKLAGRGRPVATSNRKQALLPVGAQVLPNPTGTAPGMIWSPRPGFTVLTFPGVPAEMRAMWNGTAVDWLSGQGFGGGVFQSRLLRFWGIGESSLAEQVDDLLALENPTVAPYAGAGEVKLRLTARADTAAAARGLLVPVEAELRERTGLLCFGADDDSLASVVLELLRQRGQTLAVAESCTGGGLGAALAGVAGASDVFLGGVISYSNRIKQELMEVPAGTLAAYGAVSDPVALAMAEGVRRRLGSDWAMAVTGIAGPGGGSADKPVGQVHFAVAGPDGSEAASVRFGARRGRAWIQTLSVGEALNQLRLRLGRSSR